MIRRRNLQLGFSPFSWLPKSFARSNTPSIVLVWAPFGKSVAHFNEWVTRLESIGSTAPSDARERDQFADDYVCPSQFLPAKLT